MADAVLVNRLHDALPQTQCTRCGYPDCRRYAEAIAAGEADINQCPPGGAEGIVRLSAITGKPSKPLNPDHGVEGPRAVAVIDEDWCIGCTLCIKACPVDCIAGASKRMHTIIEAQCTGCELCIPACPVDCIRLEPVTDERTGWAAWDATLAVQARQRYEFRTDRLRRDKSEQEARLARRAETKLVDLAAHTTLTDPAAIERKRELVEAALARARASRAEPGDATNAGTNGASK
jgi:Na+-translocating ferredoxin:NAD+ oxidoreductase subunit B